MCGAQSDPPHKGQVAGPVVWLNLYFGVFVCVYRIRPVLKDLFLFLRSHIWHGPKLVITELRMRKGLCCSLPCARVRLCCILRRIMQFLPELVKQCIRVSFTKVMVGVYVMF
jgi:hypothetical protein